MDIDGLNIEFARKLHQSFKSEIEKNATVASVAILHNEQLAAAVSWGVKDSRTLQPASIEDLYNIGSVSKLYCVAAIMKLVEMERLSLDDFVYEILPEFKMADERYKDITVKMLINHSSGLPGTNFRGAMNSEWLGDNYYEKCYEWFANCKLKAKPGKFSVYCNDGFTLAEMIVVRISGLSFGEFIKGYVSQPMGAYSTCTGERYSKGHTLVSYDGVHEMALVGGAGGISTCISDSVKFGNVFINPNGLLKDQSIRLMTSPQGRTFLKEDSFTRNFGLGWDSVDFEMPDYDLGEGTLLKEGSTFQFKTSLLVCKKYSVTAAISMIPKSPFNTTKALVEIVASYLELNNHNIKDRSVHCHKTLSTFPLNEDYSGIYLNADVTYKIYHSLNRLEVSHLQPSGFKPLAILSYQYGTFTDGKENTFTFEKFENRIYLYVKKSVGMVPFAVQLTQNYPLNAKWQSRIGRKYIACNRNPYDLSVGMMGDVLTIDKLDDTGVLYFATNGGAGYNMMPAIAKDDYSTEMFLDTPGFGSRDIFAPFVIIQDAHEMIYDRDYYYLDVTSLHELSSGEIVSDKDEWNPVFKMHKGYRLRITKPENVIVLMLDEELKRYYLESNGSEIPETCEGYIVFLNKKPMRIHIELEKLDYKCFP